MQFIGASEREDQTLLIMEYMPGDLYHRIRKDGKNKHLRWYNRSASMPSHFLSLLSGIFDMCRGKMEFGLCLMVAV